LLGNVYDLYHNRLKYMIIVYRIIKINLWNVRRENVRVYVRREGSSI
jgi:hypothetical protein